MKQNGLLYVGILLRYVKVVYSVNYEISSY
jgi:hypothetical protein